MGYKHNPNVQIRAEDGTAISVNEHGSQVQITQGHYDTHAGDMYTIAGRTSDLGDGDSVDLLMVVPDTAVELHTVMSMSTSQAGYGELWEDATALLAGATLTAYNNNRSESDASTLIVYAEPTSLTLATATRLDVRQIGGGTKGAFGGEVQQDVGWILKRDTCYIVRYIANTGSTDVSFEIQYHEHV